MPGLAFLLAKCCSVLQCAVVCCSVLHCVVVCCSMLQCVAVCCRQGTCSNVGTKAQGLMILSQSFVLCCSVLQCVVVCCSVLQSIAVCCSVIQYVALCSSVLQCVAACFWGPRCQKIKLSTVLHAIVFVCVSDIVCAGENIRVCGYPSIHRLCVYIYVRDDPGMNTIRCQEHCNLVNWSMRMPRTSANTLARLSLDRTSLHGLSMNTKHSQFLRHPRPNQLIQHECWEFLHEDLGHRRHFQGNVMNGGGRIDS